MARFAKLTAMKRLSRSLNAGQGNAGITLANIRASHGPF